VRITPRTSLPLLLALLVLSPAGISGITAADEPEKSPWDLKLFRFEFDNDSFIGSDDAFSAGWSFQVHSRLMDEWNPPSPAGSASFPPWAMTARDAASSAGSRRQTL
jgi:hypothetical protein